MPMSAWWRLNAPLRSRASLQLCLLSYAEQVVYSGFLALFYWKQLPAAENNAVRAVRVNQSSKVATGQLNNELKL